MKIITRFAPSPTGFLHLGGARTAFYSWLYARKYKGKFLLRIEDSDNRRCKKQYTDNIIQSLNWLNIDWDLGPFLQRDRYYRYYLIMNNLLNNNLAYKCYCSQERLHTLRNIQLKSGQKPKYDKHCLFNTSNNINKLNYVVRFNTPDDGKISFTDLIRGEITFNNKELDDVIICRSDGNFTYNFCAVVDDFDMGVTHIIRGEDHINNTPRQIHIFKALNMKEIPQYAHLSMLLDINKKKISKRQQSINILDYKKEGYLPISILNYLFNLNNNQYDNKFFSLKQLIKNFQLNLKNKSAIIFDNKKLSWYNKYYLKKTNINLLIYDFNKYLYNMNKQILLKVDIKKVISLLKNRCVTLKNMYDDYIYLYKNINTSNSLLLIYKFKLFYSLSLINNIYYYLLSIKTWSEKNINKHIQKLLNIKVNNMYINKHDFYMFLRILFIEKTESPSIILIMEILGKSVIIKKVHDFILKNKIY